MGNYSKRLHIGCGGNLSFEKVITVPKVLNQREVDRGEKAIIKYMTKNLYKCDKCHELVNVITCPSWETLVLQGKIRVAKAVYFAIKKARKAGAIRL